MSKLLRTTDRILLGLALLGDLVKEIESVGGVMGGVYRGLYGFTPSRYKKSNLYSEVSRMLKTGVIEKTIKDGKVYVTMTNSGNRKLTRKFPLLGLQKRKWDGLFRILIFDIPETQRRKRDLLRDKLKELGFGMIQKSVWITPHPFESDMREFLEAEDLDDYVQIFVSKAYHFKNVSEVINGAWNIDSIESAYNELIKSYDKENPKGFMSDYLNIVSADPFLPKAFLPKPWVGDKAYELFRKIAQSKVV